MVRNAIQTMTGAAVLAGAGFLAILASLAPQASTTLYAQIYYGVFEGPILAQGEIYP